MTMMMRRGTEAAFSYLRKSPTFRTHLERRNALWIEVPFPIVVRGIDGHGRHFEEHTVLDILSADRLYVRTARQIAPGTSLFVFVQFRLRDVHVVRGPGIAARCVVLRAELTNDNRCGLELTFVRHRFLFASDDGAVIHDRT